MTFNMGEGYHCTCDGFKYRKTCRHVTAIEESGARCGWGADAWANMIYHEKTCPECGEDTVPFYVGV